MAKKAARRRANGEGTLFQTKGRLWRGAVSYRDPDTGEWKREWVSSQKQAVARERLTTLRRKLDRGSVPDEQGLRTDAYLKRWLEGLKVRVKPTTWRGHELNVRLYLSPHLGHRRLSRLTPTDVEQMTGRLVAEGHAPTARNARATLRQALRTAVRDRIIDRNVAELSEPVKVPHRDMTVLTGHQINKLTRGVVNDELGPLPTVLVFTGMRVGEALALTWDDLSHEYASLTIGHTLARDWDGSRHRAEAKTKKSRRTLPLTTQARDALRRQRASQNRQRLLAGDAWNADDYVFTDAIGRPRHGKAVGDALRVALSQLGLPRIRVHDLRHTAASLMLANGAHMKVISDYLGHSTVAITSDLYAHLDEGQLRGAADALEQAVGDF